MRADDISSKLAALFPKAFADAEKAQERMALYREHLDAIEPERLAIAYRRTMADWRGWDPPLPAHILDNLPPIEGKTTATTDSRMDDREVEAIMADLVTSSLGREIVQQGLAHLLEDLVRRRDVSHLGQMSRGLIDRLRSAKAKFEDGTRAIDPAGPFADTLVSMAEKLRARAEKSNAKWRQKINQTQGAA